MIKAILIALAIAFGLIEFPVLPHSSSVISENEEQEWSEFHADAFDEYADEFTRLFESYDYKLSKNGRSMIRREGEKSFRFVRMA